jgi:LuxR family transcriptional regulator, maltose regulon positive regulatory protein
MAGEFMMSESGRGGGQRRASAEGAGKARAVVAASERGPSYLARLRARIPQGSPLMIRRERLLAELNAAADRAAVTLIQAPPGYGKTSLMSQWAAGRTDDGVAWLSITAAEDDLGLLLDSLAEALRHAGVTLPASERSPAVAATPRLAVQTLLDAIHAHRSRLSFCIDDIHNLTEHTAIEAISTLIEGTSAGFRMILATRQTPPLLMGRLRAYGDLAEFGADHLRFAKDELVAFFSRNGPLDLSPEEMSVIEQRTEGWAVGLKLTSMVLRNSESRAEMLSSLTGDRRQLVSFFGEELFARQPARLQQFLLRTSILDRFCADLCVMVGGERQAQELIEQCESKGLFVMPLDSSRTWYRYHNLFAQFLQRKLQDQHREEVGGLHRIACEWLLGAGFSLEAIEHALAAGDTARAGEILEARADRLFSSDEQPTVVRLAMLLPTEIRNRLPTVLLMVAWRLISTWRLEDAEAVLSICRDRITELRSAGGERKGPDTDLLESYVQHRQLNIAIIKDDLARAEQLATQLLAREPPLIPYLKASVYHDLLDAQRGQLNLSQVDRIEALTRPLNEAAGSEYGDVFDAARLGAAHVASGRLEDANRVLTRGMAAARRLSRHVDDLLSVPAMPLAALLYERNDISGARQLIDRYLSYATSFGIVDQLVMGWLTQARMLWLDGAGEKAIQVLKDARVFGSSRGLCRLQVEAETAMIRLLLSGGQVPQALAINPDLAALTPARLLSRHRQATQRGAAESEAWVRMAIAHGRSGPALEVIRHWRRLLGSTLAVPLIVRWDLLQARALFVDGQQTAAMRALDSAIRRAEPVKLMRTFLDEGGVIGTLFEKMADARLTADSGASRYCTELLGEARLAGGAEGRDAGSVADATGLLGSLSRRELEVLRIAAMRVSNREIGEALGLTEGSVKWYLQRVYDKFGVRKRSEAARKARLLGLIS